MNLTVEQISELVYEIYGIVNEHFVKRQYIGYTKEQAMEKFINSMDEGEL